MITYCPTDPEEVRIHVRYCKASETDASNDDWFQLPIMTKKSDQVFSNNFLQRILIPVLVFFFILFDPNEINSYMFGNFEKFFKIAFKIDFSKSNIAKIGSFFIFLIFFTILFYLFVLFLFL